ncbi:Protection of telomeres protein 1b [Zea mays]|uniref:Protection of telomeres 1b protein n=3 Tax=Zea mays TaxID=4577 RepID=B4FEN8_MAIZE|nr:Protection of telomeres protein 1b [Zea mays]ACF80581.1 unknown [Zea mays]ACJ49166.1 protection of telomeres 1b protein [Zea mays]AQK47239.1 Protection of telomeres protein 1b [Zea mays]|eukprot:NP_001141490.1 uncharacterized protein LOC100273602 [Zea mays]
MEEDSSAMEPNRLREAEAAAGELKRLREAGQSQYMYRSIADARVVGGRVCLFAVVSEIGATVHSRGTDFTVTLRVIDESYKSGISVTFFADSTALLPCVKSCGDVISLHNVVIKKYRDFFVQFDKKYSSFALFEGKTYTECSPYQTSIRYHDSEHDKDFLNQMRTWLPQGLKDFTSNNSELYLMNLKSDSTFDLVCKVFHVHVENNNSIFYVWDGTDTPAAEFPAILDAEAAKSLSLHEGPPLSREILCTMPDFGTVLRIFSDRFVNKVSYMQKNIYWARFWNITCKQNFGIWKGTFSDSGGVRLLSNKDDSVVDRLKMYDSRIANRVRRRPMASIPSSVTDVEYEDAGYASLMKSLTHHDVTHKLRTLVRVVAAHPCEASLLSTGNCHLRLTLEDPTARIHAYVHKNDLVGFFGGGFLTAEVIVKKMNMVLGIPEPQGSVEVAPSTRNPPWIWCCLMSYYMDKNDPWVSRKYRIYSTAIRD